MEIFRLKVKEYKNIIRPQFYIIMVVCCFRTFVCCRKGYITNFKKGTESGQKYSPLLNTPYTALYTHVCKKNYPAVSSQHSLMFWCHLEV